MIVHDFPQRTPEWYEARLGVATASSFDQILTAAKGDVSKSMDKYIFRNLAELFTGQSQDAMAKSYWMERGQELEAQAVLAYELETGETARDVGFITTDCGMFGASLDRLVGNNGGAEIKCPSPTVHLEYMYLGDKLAHKYRQQLQGQIFVCGLDWVDFFSYHPDFPPAYLRVLPDEEYQEKMALAFDAYRDLFNEIKADLIAKGCTIKKRAIQPSPQFDAADYLRAG